MKWWRLAEALASMYVGILLASVVGSRPRCVRAMVRPLRPLLGEDRMGRAAVLSVLSSSVAMYAARDAVQGVRDVVALLLLMAFPSSIAAAVQFYLPVVAPLVGPACPVLVAVSTTSALITTLIGRASRRTRGDGLGPVEGLRLVREPVRTANRVFLRVGPPVVAVILLFHWCERSRLLDPLVLHLAPLVSWFHLPPASSLVILGCLANVSVGAVIGAELVDAGRLDWWDAALSLSLGRAVSLLRIHAQFLAPPAASFFGHAGIAGVAIRTLVESAVNAALVWVLSLATHPHPHCSPRY
ncbi:MAG: hypothetical protein ABGY09_05680 [Euryarchaeota archaeon]